MKKLNQGEVYISHVLFPWETFQAQGEREAREKANGGARWTPEFLAEVRQNIERYNAEEDRAIRNYSINEVYNMVPFHFREELFAGITFRLWPTDSERR